jgi:hypothetical protein
MMWFCFPTGRLDLDVGLSLCVEVARFALALEQGFGARDFWQAPKRPADTASGADSSPQTHPSC